MKAAEKAQEEGSKRGFNPEKDLEECGITDLLMLGFGRPMHLPAQTRWTLSTLLVSPRAHLGGAVVFDVACGIILISDSCSFKWKTEKRNRVP